jgi:hypothetical protein
MTRLFRLILATVALVATVAACGGAANGPGVATLDDPAASTTPAASPSAMTPQDAAVAYARCMRENGVDMPDPVVTEGTDGGMTIDQEGGTPVSKEQMGAADQKCHHIMANARPGGPGAELSAEDLDKMLKFAQCMRAHGVDMPDPDPNGGFVVRVDDSGSATSGGAFSPEDSDFKAAQTACASLLPGKLGKPGLSGGGGEAKPGSGPVDATNGAAGNQ